MQAAGRPLAAAEMVLVRIAYAADLPTPDEVVRLLGEDGAPARARRAMAAPLRRRRRISTRVTKRRAGAPRSSGGCLAAPRH